MGSTMGDSFTVKTQIRKLPYRIIRHLCQLLNIPGRKNWEALISVLPDEMYSYNDVLMFRGEKNPAEQLISDLGHQLMTVKKLITYLEKIEHHEALLLLKPHERVQITEQPTSKVAQEGNSVTLECKATGFPRPEFEWFHNGELVEAEADEILMFETVSLNDAGEYQCKVTNPMGSEYTNTVTLQVMPVQGIQVVSQPVSDAVYEGEAFEFSCEAEGDCDLSYQWMKDGYPIPGATNPTLCFPAVQPRDNGNYSCKITGPLRDIITQIANLAVISEVTVRREVPRVNQSPRRREYPSIKLALLIGNEKYKMSTDKETKLVHPEDDVYTLQRVLFRMGFKFISCVNLDLTQMENAISGFCNLLKQFPGAYGLFYFGGHGFEVNGKTYLVPCDAPQEWTPSNSICAENILSRMQDSDTKLNALILDVCRKCTEADGYVPEKLFDPPFRAGSQSIVAYSTCPQSQAFEKRKDTNGIYVKHLAQFLELDERIEDVIRQTNEEVHKETESQPVTQTMHPTFKSALTRCFSLQDPAMFNPVLDREAADLWLSYNKLPANRILDFEHDITVVVRFISLFQNSAFVSIHVSSLGNAFDCEPTLHSPPEGIEVPLGKMNQKRSVDPPGVIARSHPSDLTEMLQFPTGFEYYSRLDGFENMPASFVMPIQVKYTLDGDQSFESHKTVRYDRDEFGATKFFASL